MKLLTTAEIKTLKDEHLVEEIINIKKLLLNFKLKQATRQPIKSHLFKLYKCQLAKILTIKHKR